MAMGCMELRRLGLVTKPVVVAPYDQAKAPYFGAGVSYGSGLAGSVLFTQWARQEVPQLPDESAGSRFPRREACCSPQDAQEPWDQWDR
jgi:hypothetical protein